MMTGWPLKPRFSSNAVRAEARKAGFSGEPEIEGVLKAGTLSVKEGSARYAKSVRCRAAFSKRMIERNDYDLALVCFSETDRMQHYITAKNWEALLMPLYNEVSELLAWLAPYAREVGGDYEIVLFSDHGSQQIKNKFLLNAWLVNNGYAKLKDSIIEGMKNAVSGAASTKYLIREKLFKSGLRKVYNRMPENVKSTVASAAGKVFSGTSGSDYTRIHDFDFDMHNTRAFASVSNNPVGTIFINDRRFADPRVSAAEKPRIKAELARALGSLRSPEGDRFVKRVVDGGRYYRGLDSIITPDLLVEVKPSYTIDIFYYSQKSSLMKPELAKSGDHTMHGIFGMLGSKAGYLNAYSKRDMDVCKIAPLIFEYFGVGGAR
jgi:predicted AlkP superfamily phosphohydrolase/phosphomutase